MYTISDAKAFVRNEASKLGETVRFSTCPCIAEVRGAYTRLMADSEAGPRPWDNESEAAAWRTKRTAFEDVYREKFRAKFPH